MNKGKKNPQKIETELGGGILNQKKKKNGKRKATRYLKKVRKNHE